MIVRLTMGRFSDRTDPDTGMFSGRVYDNGLLLNNKTAIIT